MTQSIASCVQHFFASIDSGNWEDAQQQMKTPFHLDYSSFGAGPAADLDLADIMAGWRKILPGFDAIQHHLGALNIQADDTHAAVHTNVIATHYVAGAQGGEIWTVYGDYELRLEKADSWQLSAITFNFRFLTGNPDLPELAQTKAASRP